MTNTFLIEPLRGAGPLRFDMRSDAVRRVLGDPLRTGKDFRGRSTDDWENISIGYSPIDDMVNEIVISPPAVALFAGINVFDAKQKAVDLFRTIDDAPHSWMGSVVFLKASISLRGLLDPEEADHLAIAVGRPGRWEEYRHRMRPLA